MKSYFYISPFADGWQNLALDEYLLECLKPGELCLLLYVNENAVILGRNQNPWAECSLERLEKDGVQLVRRCSGGGAVFHDRGNLNYSFIAHKDLYDEEKQTALVLRVLNICGIEAEKSGRNDLTAGGRKFSGTAFCSRGENRQHHGTLLVNADLSRLSNYLTVAPQKLEAKGVKSVRSRVCNLSELDPSLTVERLSEAFEEQFRASYGETVPLPPDIVSGEGPRALYERNRSWAWQLGSAPEFDYTFEDRYSFGMGRLCVNVSEGLIRQVKLYTDALDPLLPEKLEKRLLGKPFDPAEIEKLLRGWQD